jgi:V8-like Glu-specific endopeptidase
MTNVVILFMVLPLASIAQAQGHSFSDQLSKKAIKENNLSGVCYQDIRRNPRTSTIDNSTSFFISRNCLLTSAHNVTKLLGHNVNNITIFPGRIGDEKEFDSIKINVSYKRNIRYSDKYKYYVRRTHAPFDFALIFIPDNVISKNGKLKDLSYLPLLENSDSLKVGDTLYCVGYPAEGEYNGQYAMTMDTSTVKGLFDGYFTHDLATLRGNSGSPIFVKKDNKFFVVGINSIGDMGTWLTSEKQKVVKEWISLLEQQDK